MFKLHVWIALGGAAVLGAWVPAALREVGSAASSSRVLGDRVDTYLVLVRLTATYLELGCSAMEVGWERARGGRSGDPVAALESQANASADESPRGAFNRLVWERPRDGSAAVGRASASPWTWLGFVGIDATSLAGRGVPQGRELVLAIKTDAEAERCWCIDLAPRNRADGPEMERFVQYLRATCLDPGSPPADGDVVLGVWYQGNPSGWLDGLDAAGRTALTQLGRSTRPAPSSRPRSPASPPPTTR